jgi:hypothetical protein
MDPVSGKPAAIGGHSVDGEERIPFFHNEPAGVDGIEKKRDLGTHLD